MYSQWYPLQEKNGDRAEQDGNDENDWIDGDDGNDRAAGADGDDGDEHEKYKLTVNCCRLAWITDAGSRRRQDIQRHEGIVFNHFIVIDKGIVISMADVGIGMLIPT